MKALLTLFTIFCLSLVGFSQSGIEKLKALTNTLTQPQDTAKTKTSGGTESNLAVSDEGASGGKNQKAASENPIEKLKKNLTEKAVKNNNDSGGSTGTGTSNLAVSDEGASGTKGKNNTKEAPGGTGTPAPTEVLPKTGATTDPK